MCAYVHMCAVFGSCCATAPAQASTLSTLVVCVRACVRTLDNNQHNNCVSWPCVLGDALAIAGDGADGDGGGGGGIMACSANLSKLSYSHTRTRPHNIVRFDDDGRQSR